MPWADFLAEPDGETRDLIFPNKREIEKYFSMHSQDLLKTIDAIKEKAFNFVNEASPESESSDTSISSGEPSSVDDSMDHSLLARSPSESSFTAAISSSAISAPRSSSPKCDKTNLAIVDLMRPLADLCDNTTNVQTKQICKNIGKGLNQVMKECNRLIYYFDSKNVAPAEIFINKVL